MTGIVVVSDFDDHFLLSTCMHTQDCSYLLRVTHSYLLRVTHSYLLRVTHSYLLRVTILIYYG